jgi:hypothetical protein
MSILSDLDSLVLRSAVHPPLSTKNAELTYAEWDAHVTRVYDAIQSIVSGANVTAYDAATVYDASSDNIYLKYAGYDSRAWQAIGTFSGQTPTEGIYWTQVTLAELMPDVLGVIDKTETFKKPYKTTSAIVATNAGTTITIVTADYPGDVSSVSVWDGNILLRPTIVKGLSGSDKTVTIITNKAYTTPVRITVNFE